MAEFDPNDWPRFIQLPGFATDWDRYGLGHEDLRALELAILNAPTGNPVMKGTGGLRKARFAPLTGSKGKSGSFRVAYFAFPAHGIIVLAMIWGKNEKLNLSDAERNDFATVSRQLQRLLEKGTL